VQLHLRTHLDGTLGDEAGSTGVRSTTRARARSITPAISTGTR
jgi:hypothetical protein